MHTVAVLTGMELSYNIWKACGGWPKFVFNTHGWKTQIPEEPWGIKFLCYNGHLLGRCIMYNISEIMPIILVKIENLPVAICFSEDFVVN